MIDHDNLIDRYFIILWINDGLWYTMTARIYKSIMWVKQCHKTSINHPLYHHVPPIYGDLGDGLWHCSTLMARISDEVGEAPSLNDLPSISEAVVRAVMGDWWGWTQTQRVGYDCWKSLKDGNPTEIRFVLSRFFKNGVWNSVPKMTYFQVMGVLLVCV